MARDQIEGRIGKIGVRKSAKAGAKASRRGSREVPPPEGEEDDFRRAARKGQSGKKGRPLPSMEVAVKRPGRKRSKRKA